MIIQKYRCDACDKEIEPDQTKFEIRTNSVISIKKGDGNWDNNQTDLHLCSKKCLLKFFKSDS